MTPDGLFGLLSSVSCGAFVLATDQTVVFWNRRAREILGYRPDRVVGRRCSGIVPEVEGLTLTGDCEEGCLMLRSLRAGLVPGRARIRMRSWWGEWKWLTVTPMVVSGVEDDGPLPVYCSVIPTIWRCPRTCSGSLRWVPVWTAGRRILRVMNDRLLS